MNNPPFKPGDKVRLVNKEKSTVIKIGEITTLLEDDDGNIYWEETHKLELAIRDHSTEMLELLKEWVN